MNRRVGNNINSKKAALHPQNVSQFNLKKNFVFFFSPLVSLFLVELVHWLTIWGEFDLSQPFFSKNGTLNWNIHLFLHCLTAADCELSFSTKKLDLFTYSRNESPSTTSAFAIVYASKLSKLVNVNVGRGRRWNWREANGNLQKKLWRTGAGQQERENWPYYKM